MERIKARIQKKFQKEINPFRSETKILDLEYCSFYLES